MWNIQLLGGLAARSPERVVTRFRYHKAGSLLGYLACFSHAHTAPHSRETLITMFWPDADPAAGRKNLRNLLSALRPVLEPPGTQPGAVLCADRFRVHLNPDAFTCDVHQFEAAARKARAPELTQEERLEWGLKAAQLYHGPLMSGYYDEWIGLESLRLSSVFMEVALQVVPLLVQTDKLDPALPLAQRAVAIDAFSEAATYNLMRVLDAQQRPSQALQVYRQLERRLQQEWEETPSEELQSYARQLRKRPSILIAPVSTAEASQAMRPDRVSAVVSEPALRVAGSAR